ncbi:hypothetical protein D934_05750 [Xylella fastidiosa subsp. sandyi Ann-1]|uniref:Uncharacterized protein n=1 Tax=Xylella fastidiosa subsp. sandyi Ann-1 TaxID=155920 RepID=A0A060HE12_XYLFS|nr:hypothetical protein D934_05750 [Xylella fastidiosa subsp. sandyi Ann-1]
MVWGDAVLIGDFCHILSGAVGGEGEDGREEFAGCGCQKNLKDGQNRGDGGRQGKQSVAEIGMRCPAPCPVKALLARLQGCHQGEALGAPV